MESKIITLPSDDEGDRDGMPKIINTISLQGCSELSFQEEQGNEGGDDSLMYPECEIKEENADNDVIKTEDVIENGLSHSSKHKEEKDELQNKKAKKRLNLTHLSPVKRDKPSTSRREDYRVVDARRLALQESLFKTKELFDTFLRVCQDHENSEQMEKVVDKLGRAYDATRQEFLGSLAFQNILEVETEKVNTSNTKPWLNLKLVLDELKYNKKNSGSKLKLGESEESQDAGGSNDDEPVIECPKKRRHLKKLEKVLRAINLKIKKLEEREVNWDEEDNSAYCKLDRYRGQFTKIYAKICEIKGKLSDADRPYLRKVSFAGTKYPNINRCIEKYYNKHREFPDFQDIKKLVTAALKQEGVELPPIRIQNTAAEAFKEFGEMLKRLRQYDDYDVLISYLDQQVDPARDDEQLQEELNKNALLFKKKEQEVIDKFAEKESVGGICSESGDDSDSKPKKKKRKIIISNPSPKKKSASPNKQSLSSSEDSDEEDEHPKAKISVGLSSDSDSDSEKKIEKQSVVGKGKALIGKQRLIKRGVKKSCPSKPQIPKTAISSDEESPVGNTKESLTNYLGLQGTSSSKTTETKESEHVIESEDEITCINETQRKKRRASSGSSDANKTTNTKSKVEREMDVRSDSSRSSRSSTKDKKEPQTKFNAIADSDSDVEPIAVINKPKRSTVVNTRKLVNQARKSTGGLNRRVLPKRHVGTKKINAHEIISESSESESRTSKDSDSDRKKSLSDVELSPGIKDLSSDSSDEEVREKKDEEQNEDDAIVILSEDVIEESKPAVAMQNLSKPQEDSSDSDEVCILSQIATERRTVAPRKMKPNSSAAPHSSLPQRGVVTSTPKKTAKPVMRRRLSNQSNIGNNTKMQKMGVSTNVNGKQATLPQIINGASRKVLISKVSRPTNRSGANTAAPIPLIEID